MSKAMTIVAFNAYCASLPQTTHIVQWGGADVWKVGGKVFAIGGTDVSDLSVSFKCSELMFEVWKTQPGVRPAPYLASRGMIWLQRTDASAMSDAKLKHLIAESHRLVAAGLPKKTQAALGLAPPASPAKAKPKPRTKSAKRSSISDRGSP